MFRKISIWVLSILLLSSILTLFSIKANAATVTITSYPGIKTALQYVDESAGETVNVLFLGLIKGHTYYICLDNSEDLCHSHDFDAVMKAQDNSIFLDSISINVCGDGTDKLKKVDSSCGSGDYFHSGHTYHVRLYESKSDYGGERNATDVPIPISIFAPDVKLVAIKPDGSESTTPTPNDTYKVILTGRRGGGDRQNNYKIEIHPIGADRDRELASVCGAVKTDDPTPFSINKQLGAGTYFIKVNEQVNEDTSNCAAGKPYVDNEKNPFTVAPNGGKIQTGVTIDPQGEDAQRIAEAQKQIDEENARTLQTESEATPPVAPCASKDASGTCIEVVTAIGNINTDPAGFVKSIFSLLLGISGGVALILIIISGYRLMASQGNPEQVQGAREMLTSAIVGLLFIIFSFVILQIIGVSILHIPSFGP